MNLQLESKTSLFFRPKTVLEGSLEVAKNFRIYLPQFGDPMSEMSDQNCGKNRDILKKTFS